VKLILASASASRRRVLEAAHVPFEVIPASIDEDAVKDRLLANTPLADIAMKLAEAKAADVTAKHRDALVIGADQTLLFEGALISKCPDVAAARALLLRLRGKPHSLVSALVLMRGGEILWRHESRVHLTMRHFSDAFLDWYLAEEGEGLLAGVGCYRLEGPGSQLFASVEGDYFSTLGLPLLPLLAELRRQSVIAT
jgi:septum formation protein